MTNASISVKKISYIPWWIVLIQGIMSLIFGLLFLTSPAMTTAVLVQFMAIYWLIGGVLNIIQIFMDSSLWGLKLFSGVLGIIAAIAVLQHPLWSTILVPTVIVIFIAIDGLVIGITSLILAFMSGDWGAGVLGILSIIFGIILLANPLKIAIALPIVIGIFGIVGGFASVITAFRLRAQED